MNENTANTKTTAREDLRELLAPATDTLEANGEDLATAVERMAEALEEEGMSMEDATPEQLTALMTGSPDWTRGTIY